MSQRRFRAGCGREADGPPDVKELAYTELAYPECPNCRHRLEPEDGPSFCRWLPADRPDPFETLKQVGGSGDGP